MTDVQGGVKAEGGNLQLISWNVKGLGSSIKRGKVFKHLKSLSADIIFQQETHIKKDTQHRLKCNWVSQIYQSPFSSHARGVAILFGKNVPFQMTSIVTDPLGRYIMVSGIINSHPLILLNIYGPNTDELSFFKRIFDLLPDNDSNIIVAGDLNCYLDPFLDRSSTQLVSKTASSKLLNNLLKTRDMVDIWRIQHPTGREYSFYSHVHKSYTRIVYFLVSSRLISQVTNSKYYNILISDHSPLTISLNLALPKQVFAWRLNANLLKDDIFVKNITCKLKNYIELNDNGEVSDSTLWEALKTVLRGEIISYTSALKKERQKRLSEINSVLPGLERTYQVSKSPADFKEIVKLKYKYNDIMSGLVSNLLRKLRQKHFEFGDKPGMLLSRQLKGVQAARAIHSIKSKTGTLLTNPIDINHRFSEVYSELYSLKHKVLQSDLNGFFDSLQLPKLRNSYRDYLDSEFTLQEVIQAIKSFPNGKTAGPDGFCPEFYKTFCDILAPLVLRMLPNSKEEGKLPKTLCQANITLILKKGKDMTDPTNFRPIALQNFDHKIVTKILATRLNKHLASIIHPDQTGLSLVDFPFLTLGDYSISSILTIKILREPLFWPWMHIKLSTRSNGPTCLSHCADLVNLSFLG
ncbi:unnamed protein product [Oreochromis niloticus]|nr:unnamed protein product [Mustela putorius furo]